jgi:uncharacterized protein (TIGR00369 family)
MGARDEHHRHLERLYLEAPTNAYYRPAIRVGEGEAEITVAARPEFFHAMGAVHGSVYFKILDDAGYFAVNSLVRDAMVLTASFTLHLLRPIAGGTLIGRGRVVHAGRRQYLAEAQLFDDESRLAAHGVGTYVRSAAPIPARRAGG